MYSVVELCGLQCSHHVHRCSAEGLLFVRWTQLGCIWSMVLEGVETCVMVVETCNVAGDVFWWLTVQPSIMSWPTIADALASSAESSPLEPVTTWKVQCSSQLRWTVQQGRYRDCCIMHCTPCNHWVVRLLGCTHAHMHLSTIKRGTSRHADSNQRGVYCLLPLSLECHCCHAQ